MEVVQNTNDGSYTIYSEKYGETYHSVNGAIQESNHVFINAGFIEINKPRVDILEIGFGTGLNAMLTLIEAEKRGIEVSYTSLELFPVSMELLSQLNYSDRIEFKDCRKYFNNLHDEVWGEWIKVAEYFHICKYKADFISYSYPDMAYDVIYFDAFSPASQPELWTSEMFEKMYKTLRDGGILTTYCAKGQVRRNMKQAGFKVERLPGPPGKREMLRAFK